MLNGTVYPPTLNSRRHFPTADETKTCEETTHSVFLSAAIIITARNFGASYGPSVCLSVCLSVTRPQAGPSAVAELHVIMTNNTDPFSPVTQQLTYTF